MTQFHGSSGILQLAECNIYCEAVPVERVSMADASMSALIGTKNCQGITLGGEATFNLESPEDVETLKALITTLRTHLEMGSSD